MSMPLSFCDISTRYGQMPAPQIAPAEQTGWDFKQLCLDYMRKVKAKQKEDLEDAEEDALMALIDAMNVPKDRRVDPDEIAVRALERAGKAISEEHEGKVDPTQFLPVRIILSVLGDRATFEEVDGILERQEEIREEERLEVTEERDPSDPDDNKKEV